MEPGIMCIDIRREFVLEDALREARKKRFSPKKKLKVKVTLLTKSNDDYCLCIINRLLLLAKVQTTMGDLVVNFFRLLALEASEHYLQGEQGKFFTNDIIALQVRYLYHLLEALLFVCIM